MISLTSAWTLAVGGSKSAIKRPSRGTQRRPCLLSPPLLQIKSAFYWCDSGKIRKSQLLIRFLGRGLTGLDKMGYCLIVVKCAVIQSNGGVVIIFLEIFIWEIVPQHHMSSTVPFYLLILILAWGTRCFLPLLDEHRSAFLEWLRSGLESFISSIRLHTFETQETFGIFKVSTNLD